MHATNLGSVLRARRWVLFDRAPERAGQVAAELGKPVSHVATLDELLAICDRIVVAPPTGTHPELIRNAIDAPAS